MKDNLAKKNVKYTYQDLLDFEAAGSKEFELINSELHVINSAPIDHGIISTMISTLLNIQLINSDCRVIHESLKVRVKTNLSDDIFRPDVTVICPPYDDKASITTTPTLVVEVLSKSTELKDRTIKLKSYLNIEGLKGYLIVSKEVKRIEWYRIVDGKLESSIHEAGGIIKIEDWIILKVDDVYSKSNINGEYNGL